MPTNARHLIDATGAAPAEEWAAHAACRREDPDMFYPQTRTSEQPARTVCRNCPVRTDCLEHALTVGERHGIWGGMNTRERKKIVRMRERAAERLAS